MKVKALDRRSRPAGARFFDWGAPDGWSIRRMDWPQPDAAPVRGALLFAGGRGDFIEKYLEPLAHWHRRGWHVHAFDWRAQGGSRGGIAGGNFTDFDPLVADMAAILADAMAGPGPHAAIGHSMGGHLLLRTLAERAPRLDAAVLVAPMLAINTDPTPSITARWLARMFASLGGGAVTLWPENGARAAPGLLRQANLTHCGDRYADEIWWKEQEPAFHLGVPSWGWLDAAFRSIDRLSPAALQRLQTPLLLLGAEQDRLVSADGIRKAATLLPNAELRMFADAAHELLREADPVREQAFAAIDDFLDRHAPE